MIKVKTVNISIQGVVPLLMHRFPIDEKNNGKAKRRAEVYNFDKDCQKALYSNSGGCYVPSTWVSAMLKKAGAHFKKQGGSTYRDIMDASVFIEPSEIPLDKKTYDEKFIVPVVIRRQRIVKARPKFNSWRITFVIHFDEELISKDVLRQILEEGGETIGLGDWRPKYGRFKVVTFKSK